MSQFLSGDERRALKEAVLSSRQVGPGIDVVREGEHSDSLWLLAEGWACRYMVTKDGGRALPALVVAGDIGNLDSLLFDRIDYGFRTLTRATIISLSRERVLALALTNPGIAKTLTWLALVENAGLSKLALSLGRQSARERLAHLLCEVSARIGSEQDGESKFAFPLTQEQMADMLGLTPVHVNRTLRELRAERLVVSTHQVIVIPNIVELQRLAGFDPHYLHFAEPGRHPPDDGNLSRTRPSVGLPPTSADPAMIPGSPDVRTLRPTADHDLMLREIAHRCANDLQLVVGLLGFQSRRSDSPEVREALSDAMERVAVLARARGALHASDQPSLEAALRQVCEALHAQAEPRSIRLSLEISGATPQLSQGQITTLALVANELATNAIKHGYRTRSSGHVQIMLKGLVDGNVIVIVDDDGLPLPDSETASGRGGSGLGLAQRLMGSIGGRFILPPRGSKAFELRVPVGSD
jgi:two-component sensor histidine kinase